MICVIDSSFTASLFLPDESAGKSDALAKLIGEDGAAAPGLWQLEIANLLLMAERRKRITSAMQKRLLLAIDSLPVALQPNLTAKQLGDAMSLATKHTLTAYDAAYLELACRLNLPVATHDSALRRAAKAEGVAVLP